jgi:hypothetical protein
VAEAKVPGTAVTDGGSAESSRARSPQSSRARSPKDGYLEVAELVSSRVAAPSPFGDDQTFPLPIEELTYVPPTAP